MVRVQFWICFVGKANRFVYGLTVDYKSKLIVRDLNKLKRGIAIN